MNPVTSVPFFVVAQLVAALLAIVAVRVMYPDIGSVADRVVMPHDAESRARLDP